MSVYVTGDKHGKFSGVIAWGKKMGLTSEDTVIVLGDTALNFVMGWEDYKLRKKLGKCAWNWLIVRGNHDMRPEVAFTMPQSDAYAGDCPVPRATVEQFMGGKVWVQKDKNTNIKYALDGEIFDIEGQKCLVIGGGYSVDMWHRLEQGWTWHKDEQLTEAEMEYIYNIYCHNQVDVILSHVAPVSYESDIRHLWMETGGVKGGWQMIDKTMEIWMNKLLWDETNDIKRWYFGHYHSNINCADGSGVMLFDTAIPFMSKAPALYTPENDVRTEKERAQAQGTFVTPPTLCPDCGCLKDKPGVPYRCQAYLAGFCPEWNSPEINCNGCGMCNDEEDICQSDFHKEDTNDSN